MLIAATKNRIMKGYKHPLWMQAAGWIVVGVMTWMGCIIIQETISKL
jgi:Mn2+/Fe2+ NRAMP family transporter